MSVLRDGTYTQCYINQNAQVGLIIDNYMIDDVLRGHNTVTAELMVLIQAHPHPYL